MAMLDHVDCNWEQWNAYLAAELPDGADLNDSGIYCHDHDVVEIDR